MKPAHDKRNPVREGMFVRYGRTSTVMKDRRKPRGGSRNRQRDYREGNY